MDDFSTRLWKIWLPTLCLLACTCLALFLLLQKPHEARTVWRMDDTLRVGAPEPVRQATVISPYGSGVEDELVSQLCAEMPCTPTWINVPDKEEGLAMLQRGEIDLLVGFWGDVPEPAPALSESSIPEFLPEIAAGKAYAHFTPIRITGATAPKSPATPETATNETSVLKALERMFSSLVPTFVQENKETAKDQPFPVFAYDMDGGDDPNKDILLMDPASYVLWLPFMGEVGTARTKNKMPYRWFWRAEDTYLTNGLNDFWNDTKREAALAELTERYFGFLPRTLRQRDILELAETLAADLPKYEGFILKAAKESRVPPLLLVAVIYQESRFDPDAVSQTRVRGIMQLTTATARMLDVDRKNPEECILGGARYLRDLFDRIGDKAVTDWDRWFMALAAYNQGMSNLNRTIKLAQELGKKGDSWVDLKRTFPLSTTCRGVEAKSFVERIRYYHFILHGLVALAPSETQDFAPLMSLALTDADL